VEISFEREEMIMARIVKNGVITEVSYLNKRVTAEVLERLGACSRKVEEFATMFPKGVVLNKKFVAENRDSTRIDWIWATINILTRRERGEVSRIGNQEEFFNRLTTLNQDYADALVVYLTRRSKARANRSKKNG
jgi:hypothetical protein